MTNKEWEKREKERLDQLCPKCNSDDVSLYAKTFCRFYFFQCNDCIYTWTIDFQND